MTLKFITGGCPRAEQLHSFDQKSLGLQAVSCLERIDQNTNLIIVREADNLKIAQHFSAGLPAIIYSKAREAGDRYRTANDSERVKEATSARAIQLIGAPTLLR